MSKTVAVNVAIETVFLVLVPDDFDAENDAYRADLDSEVLDKFVGWMQDNAKEIDITVAKRLPSWARDGDYDIFLAGTESEEE